ncbi:amidohydrolase family protein [Embleya scabrispora]|uniref:amidohydrolase family protein n=1 Tax=Embleya scabrispora TaxID=159449 RepID=UPI0003A53DF2|nr:amidohydrolase family protein [Embleya scabrispora]MYS87754.1 amidohydrolase family protein [Streptomyces sp. SID5474]
MTAATPHPATTDPETGPRLPMVDAHHHLWDPAQHRHDWLDRHSQLLNRAWTAADLAPLATEAGITAAVAVQALSEPAETRYLLEQAAARPLIAGVVGYADLRSDHLPGDLESLLTAPGGQWLRGVRYNLIHAHEDDFTDTKLARGLRTLARYDLTFDLITTAPKLAWAARLADAAPDTRLVLDHAGNPPIAEGAINPWAAGIATLARRANVHCKLSGLVTQADHEFWTVADLRPYADVVLTAFSPCRVAIGSDWPVSLLAGTYPGVMGAYRQLVSELTETERCAVGTGTASRLYRLDITRPDAI